MEKFTVLTSIPAPLPMMNIDTDMIIPKQFLKTIKRSGLGKNLFDEMRYHKDQTENKDFILNQSPYRTSKILISGNNFGCGSSREHAPWAFLDFGIRCIIATSFADIFYNNCFKNGILPLPLPEQQVNLLMEDAQNKHELTIDLEKKHIIRNQHNESIPFDVDEFRRTCLLNGLDDIDLTLKKQSLIDGYETKVQTHFPWIAL